MRLFISVLLCCITSTTFAQEKTTTLPPVMVKDLRGEYIPVQTKFTNDGKPVVVNFWATWCKPCIQELSAIHELYTTWQQETGVKIITVSIDDARNANKVAPFVKTRGWLYDSYIDANSDLKRMMNVVNIPHTFLLNAKGEVVWQHSSYAPGDELKLFETIKRVAKGEKISD